MRVNVRDRYPDHVPNGLCRLPLTGRYVSTSVKVLWNPCSGMRLAHVPNATIGSNTVDVLAGTVLQLIDREPESAVNPADGIVPTGDIPANVSAIRLAGLIRDEAPASWPTGRCGLRRCPRFALSLNSRWTSCRRTCPISSNRSSRRSVSLPMSLIRCRWKTVARKGGDTRRGASEQLSDRCGAIRDSGPAARGPQRDLAECAGNAGR